MIFTFQIMDRHFHISKIHIRYSGRGCRTNSITKTHNVTKWKTFCWISTWNCGNWSPICKKAIFRESNFNVMWIEFNLSINLLHTKIKFCFDFKKTSSHEKNSTLHFHGKIRFRHFTAYEIRNTDLTKFDDFWQCSFYLFPKLIFREIVTWVMHNKSCQFCCFIYRWWFRSIVQKIRKNILNGQTRNNGCKYAQYENCVLHHSEWKHKLKNHSLWTLAK